MFRRSTLEAAICSIIELNCAKLNGAVSLPNPSTVACSELETNSRAELHLEQAEPVITYSLYVEPSFLQSRARSSSYFASLHQQK